MIEILEPGSPADFLKEAGDFLAENEAENNLILGLVGSLGAEPPETRPFHHLWVFRSDGRTVGAALWTPPFPAVLTRAPREALAAWLDRLESEDLAPPGVSAVPETAEFAARDWCARKGLSFSQKMNLWIYRLDRLPVLHPAPGAARAARGDDVDRLVEWTEAFSRETGAEDPVKARERVEGFFRKGSLWVWEDGALSSLAGYSGPTPTGIRINMVYTPPENRGRGYAKALVSTLSRFLLSQGLRSCFLFADRNNPASNALYRKIGYEYVADWWMLEFKSKQDK
jgi:uncharacterized protein